MKHKFYDCEEHGGCPKPGFCPYCDGGLLYCEVCNGGEASLTSECPGKMMTEEEERQVFAGVLDYRDGKWVKRPNPTNQTWEKAKRLREKGVS
jgi:hypothetical protein